MKFQTDRPATWQVCLACGNESPESDPHPRCRRCGGMLEIGVGRASNLAIASLPGFVLPSDISASDRYYKRDITNERFVLNSDSTIDVPTGPGLGVTIDQAALKEFTLTELMIRADI